MKKLLLVICLLFSYSIFSQNFDSFASALRINETIYNTTGSGINLINPNPGAPAFEGATLGVFGQNSACARITGSEVKTWKTASGNVCSTRLYWRVYPATGLPTGTFNTISLGTVSDCNTSSSVFFDGLGPCSSNDQKWKDYTINVDFISGLTPGDYILEVYYDFSGSDVSTSSCETTKFINNSNENFKGSFSISNPTCNPTITPTTVCEGTAFQLIANPANGVAPYTYSWSGPNGFTSSLENPTVIATLLSGGIYSLSVTDSCGATSIVQNTSSLSITPRIDPEFEGLNPGLCRFGTPPLLPNMSSNGISGTWNPAIVDNSVTGVFQYTFTPDAGECANNFVQTIFVVNNVTPNFTLPNAICQGATPPVLNTNSNNGIIGTWSPSIVSNTTSGSYTFTPNAGQCATVRTVTINVTPNAVPTFTLPSSICENTVAPTLPTIATNGISGSWNPTSVSNTTTGTYVFTPSIGQCATTTSITITVNPNITPTFAAINDICEGAIAPSLPTVSTNGISGTWNPTVVSNTTSATYTFTPNEGQCALQTTLDVNINQNVLPIFDPISNICYQTTAPQLPLTSTNGITRTWNPATISTTTSGSYTFTPTAGLCATPTTITVTVDIVNPLFDAIAPICEGDTPPALPNTSTNGITGTWNPATISNTASGNYTFTPDAGQCATDATISITITPNITPIFITIPPICENAVAPILPSTSTNGITGTWEPAIVNTTTTTNYIFTPSSNQCATNFTLTITVNPNVTPTFNAINPICEGAVAPILQTISNNGIAGTWTPSTISNTNSGTYTFTPNAGLCALQTTIDVIVNPNLTPTFDPVAAICSGDTAPILPLISTNGIFGTWNPSTVSNSTSGVYTFTPNDGQCAISTTITITIDPNNTPTFDAFTPICFGTIAPILPLMSNNGITGTWNPSTVSNTSSGTYTFTPDAGQCATTTTTTIVVNTITPSFDAIPSLCFGSNAPLLPSTSNNGITGTWNPSTISTITPGSYTFTPDTGQCAVETSITITITTITPSFDAFADVCFGSTAPILPTTSNNGITGIWNPTIINNTASGTYTFTPTDGQCATEVSFQINVNSITPLFDSYAPICENGAIPVLPLTSLNGVTGTWNPATVSVSASGTYTFTPNAGQCATTTSVNIVINSNLTPTFDAFSEVCFEGIAPQLPLQSNNGIAGTWNPSTVSNTTSGTYTFTPDANQCATTVSITINVNSITPTFSSFADVCAGSTPPILPSTSNNGIIGTWNPAIVDNFSSGIYTFTPNPGQCANLVTLAINVNTITPIFDAILPLCENALAPILPLTSNNGISGTWNPAAISTTTSGTYTFTPNDGQCAIATSLNIVVNTNILPSFDAIPSICFGAPAPVLSLISNNGISGTWNPSTVSNTIEGTYTFTPDPNQCATSTSITINVTVITPSFDEINPICENDAAPSLASTSLNGITGTWNPTVVSNTTSQTYTFTPDSGQCAISTSLNVVVNANVTPLFNINTFICFNATAPLLPLLSDNGISGTWNPPTINNTIPGTYTFTPDSGQCATTAVITTTINSITPMFDPIADVCLGSAAPTLPLVSNNGISGTWNPSIVNNLTPGTYTFTPNAEQCALPVSIVININSITPIFDEIAPVCLGSVAPILPSSSTNGILGSWNPATVSNTSSGIYTFTPNIGQCATITSISVSINSITPTFDVINPICENGIAPTLPLTSTNGILGTWNPSIVNNTSTGTYTFTPNAGQCATVTTLNVVVNPIIIPTFNSIANVCENSIAPTLPSTSVNGISGTWNPAIISNTTSGTYTFIPNTGQCATVATLSVTVTPQVVPIFAPIASFCSGTTPPTLPLTSLNGVTGTWNATINNVSTASYQFTPNANQCATTTTVTVIVNAAPTDIEVTQSNVVNETAQGTIIINSVTGGTGPFIYSLNGTSFSSTIKYDNLSPGDYSVIVQDSNGCSFEKTVTITSSCLFPKGISPNGDGKNDTLNLIGCNVIKLEIFNRYGIKVNSFVNYTSQWAGTSSNGDELPDGTYFYVAELTDGSAKTGWIYINK